MSRKPQGTSEQSWTDERVKILKRLWAEGKTGTEVAVALGGVSRCAAIGKLHRMGLTGREKDVEQRRLAAEAKSMFRAKKGEKAAAKLREKALNSSSETEPDPVEEKVVQLIENPTIMELNERTCRWPIGDPSQDDFHFCGKSSEIGIPYCTEHCEMAYQTVNGRQREQNTAGG